jgi:hypothetical protein
LAIMAMSSCSRLWQWKMYFPAQPAKRIAITASSGLRRVADGHRRAEET